jgi:malate dehydrogenase
VQLKGEYGIDDVVVGVPVKLGAAGVEQVLEFALTNDEMSALRRSADAVRETVALMGLR